MNKFHGVRVIVLFVLYAYSFGQSDTAKLSGAIADPAGTLIRGVTITATHRASGVGTSVTSDEAGAYNFQALRVGIYGVSAEAPGFRTQTYTEVHLENASHVRLNFTLTPTSGTQK